MEEFWMQYCGGRIMCKAAEVGKIVINKCLDKGLPIDVQKLQKLLVLMQVECIKRSGKPLFVEDIRIWDCGVAIKEVDEEFRSVGVAFGADDRQVEFINLLIREKESVDTILDLYGNMNALELNALPMIQNILNLANPPGGPSISHIKYQKLVEKFRPNESKNFTSYRFPRQNQYTANRIR